MLIYTHNITERCSYVFDLIFSHLLNLAYTVTDNLQYYNSFTKEKIAYTINTPGSGFFIRSTTLLFEHTIHDIEPDVFPFGGTQAFFRTHTGSFPFDVFAASFYLVSRYEEYLPSPADKYGRFQAKNSVAGKHGFLHIPVVNYWVRELKNSLLLYYPLLPVRDASFQSVTTFDIDVAYAYKGRSFFRNACALLKDLAFARSRNCIKRIKVISGKEQDPYDTYAVLQKTLSQYKTETIFFFLLASTPTPFDRNLSPSSGKLVRLIRNIGSFSNIGIHPSYFCMEEPALLQREKQRLENISHRQITKSRQHYLRFRLPDTYRNLVTAGITDDYSMGYAEIPGFRAGICTPFNFYDVREDKATTLKIHPITYMDGSFIEDLHMHPKESLEMIRHLVDAVKKVNGVFMCVWHNHTVSDYGEYKGWKQVLIDTLVLVNASCGL